MTPSQTESGPVQPSCGRLKTSESTRGLCSSYSVWVPAKAGTQTEYELHKPLVLSDVLSLPHEGWTVPDSVCEGVICCQKGGIDDATVVDVIQELNFGRCQGKDALQQWKSSLPERCHIRHRPVVHGTTTQQWQEIIAYINGILGQIRKADRPPVTSAGCSIDDKCRAQLAGIQTRLLGELGGIEQISSRGSIEQGNQLARYYFVYVDHRDAAGHGFSHWHRIHACLLYTSDAADDLLCVDL